MKLAMDVILAVDSRMRQPVTLGHEVIVEIIVLVIVVAIKLLAMTNHW